MVLVEISVQSPDELSSACHALRSDEFRMGKKLKIKHEEIIVDNEDNWIARCLYGGPIGLIINFTLLIAVTIYSTVSIRDKLNDQLYHEKVFKEIWLPQLVQLFNLALNLDLAMNAFILLVLFPLSRVSRSTIYYWFIGVACSTAMLALICAAAVKMSIVVRMLIIVDFSRLCMKITSFLIECNESQEEFDKSTVETLRYFLFVPSLVYKSEYPRSLRIRWLKVIGHLWWLSLFLVPVMGAVDELSLNVDRFDIATETLPSLLLKTSLALMMSVTIGVAVIWFVFLENWCGLHGELLRHPYLKLFDDLPHLFTGSNHLRVINTIASQWMKLYIYVPAIKSGAGRYRAILYSTAVFALIYEVCAIYTFNIFVSYHLIANTLVISTAVTVSRKKGIIYRLIFITLSIAAGFICLSYPLEYITIHFSSMSDLESVEKIKLIPVYLSYLVKKYLEFPQVLTFTAK